MKNFEVLESLIKFNTIKDKDNKEIIEYISTLLEKKGFKIEIVNGKNHKSCLIAKSMDDCKLCFMGHSDTVNYSDGWESNPFTLSRKDDYLYGLGVCDMKGGIAAFIDSILSTNVDKLKYGIMVIITYDEEIGFKGIKLVKDRKDIPRNIIICEPTDLIPIAYSKGCMEYKVTFKGKAVHSSVMINGDNAINKAMSFIRELNKLFEELKVYKNRMFEIPFTTMNIATINGGNSINIVPDRCELTFDFRTVVEDNHEFIRKRIQKICGKYNLEYELMTNILPSNNKSKELVCLVEELSSKKSTGVNYVTEGNFLKNKDVIVIGPGPVCAHEVNEHIKIDSYNKAVEIYKNLINSICK